MLSTAVCPPPARPRSEKATAPAWKTPAFSDASTCATDSPALSPCSSAGPPTGGLDPVGVVDLTSDLAFDFTLEDLTVPGTVVLTDAEVTPRPKRPRVRRAATTAAREAALATATDAESEESDVASAAAPRQAMLEDKIEDAEEVLDVTSDPILRPSGNRPFAEAGRQVCLVCGLDSDGDKLLLCDQPLYVSARSKRHCDAPYHYRCVGLTGVPKGKWFCPDCKTHKVRDLRKLPSRCAPGGKTCFRIQQIVGKGFCVCINRACNKGDRLLTERWLASGTEKQVTKTVCSNPSIQAKVMELHPRVSDSAMPLREQVLMKIAGCGFEHLTKKTHIVLLHCISFVSHSCVPNCTLQWDTEAQTATLYARCPLAPNEELTITYLADVLPRGSRATRHDALECWGFTCACVACEFDAPNQLRAMCHPVLGRELFCLYTKYYSKPAYRSQAGIMLYWYGSKGWSGWWIGRSLGGDRDVYAFNGSRSDTPPLAGWTTCDDESYLGPTVSGRGQTKGVPSTLVLQPTQND